MPSWPLLSPKPFADFTPDEYLAYIRTLYREPEKKIAATPKDYSVRLNAKGNPVITVRRTPKWLTPDEVKKIAEELSLTYQSVWMTVSDKKKKITIKRD